MNRSRSALTLFFLLNAVAFIQALVIIETGPKNGTSYRSAEIYRKGDDYNANFEPITGALALESEEDISGKIVFIEDLPKRLFWAEILSLMERGAKAVIHGTSASVPGREYCIYTGEDAAQIQIQVSSVNIADFSPVLNQLTAGYQINVTLTSEGNQWSLAFISLPVTIVMRGLYGAASIGLIVFGTVKLIFFVKRQGAHFNVAQICLALEIIANIWRILSNIVDPLGCYQVLPSAFSNYVNAAALPFGTATFVLVTFYWHEILSDSSIKIHIFLARLRIPFYVVMFAMIAVDLTLQIAGYYVGFGATLPITLVYLTISVAFLIFYIITAVKINKRMKEADKVRKVERLNRVNAKMIMNASSRSAAIISAIIFSIFSSDPQPQMIAVFFLAGTLLFDSFCRMFLFDIPRSKGESTSGTSTGRNGTTAVNAETNLTSSTTNDSPPTNSSMA